MRPGHLLQSSLSFDFCRWLTLHCCISCTYNWMEGSQQIPSKAYIGVGHLLCYILTQAGSILLSSIGFLSLLTATGVCHCIAAKSTRFPFINLPQILFCTIFLFLQPVIFFGCHDIAPPFWTILYPQCTHYHCSLFLYVSLLPTFLPHGLQQFSVFVLTETHTHGCHVNRFLRTCDCKWPSFVYYRWMKQTILVLS